MKKIIVCLLGIVLTTFNASALDKDSREYREVYYDVLENCLDEEKYPDGYCKCFAECLADNIEVYTQGYEEGFVIGFRCGSICAKQTKNKKKNMFF